VSIFLGEYQRSRQCHQPVEAGTPLRAHPRVHFLDASVATELIETQAGLIGDERAKPAQPQPVPICLHEQLLRCVKGVKRQRPLREVRHESDVLKARESLLRRASQVAHGVIDRSLKHCAPFPLLAVLNDELDLVAVAAPCTRGKVLHSLPCSWIGAECDQPGEIHPMPVLRWFHRHVVGKGSEI
jgi:hypothetical protein